MRKTFGIILATCMAAMAAIVGASSGSAAETSRQPAAANAGVMASPKCSGTFSYGPIRYQVCVRYNCDSNSCFHRGYLGLINTASSARTVYWGLEYSFANDPGWHFEDSHHVTLAAGQQITIYALDDPPLDSACDTTVWRRLTIAYSSGESDPIHVSDYMACR